MNQEAQPPLPNRSERDWTEDFTHENGKYQNKCIHCHLLFYGHKRRVVCKICQEQPPLSDLPELSEGEIKEIEKEAAERFPKILINAIDVGGPKDIYNNDIGDFIRIYIEAITLEKRRSKKREQWISVKDRLPSEKREYLCVGFGLSYDATFHTNTKEWTDPSDGGICRPTHWRELPQPPDL